MEKIYDVIIVGSGPAGLGAAIYGKRAMLEILVIEKAGYSGGQVVSTSDVDNYLGLQGINGFDMAMNFRSHAEHFGTEFVDGDVLKIEKNTNDNFYVHLVNGDIFETKTVILAMGAKHSKLDILGESEYTGKGVSYCATCDGAFYKEKTVAVVGGGDVALEDAIYLSKIAKKVYIIHRRNTFRGAKQLQDKVLNTENIEFIKDSIVTEIKGEDKVTALSIKNVKSAENNDEVKNDEIKNDKERIGTERIDTERIDIEVDGCFIAIGMKPETELVKGFVELDEKGYIVAGEDGNTSLEGIFVAGDIRTKKLRQIITAVADGANCITSVEEYLNKRK